MLRLRRSLLVLVLPALMLTSLYLWMRDQPLDPQAKLWLDEVNSHRQSSDGYLYLLGLDARDEPMAVGRTRLMEYRPWREQNKSSGNALVPKPVAPLIYATTTADCGGYLNHCLEPLRGGSLDIEALLQQGETLLSRYQHVAELTDLRSRIAFDAHSPMPDYKALIQANRLLTVQAYRMIQLGEAERGRALLEEDITRWRKHLAEADTLIAKMVFARLVSADLGFLSALRQHGLIAQPSPQVPLNPAERSLEAPMRTEFVMLANGFTGLSSFPSAASELGKLRVWLLFKPNMTINAALPRYARVVKASSLDAVAFAEWLEQPVSKARGNLRNPIGNALVDIAGPDLSKYIARMHDLNARIALYNRINQLEPGASTAQALAATAAGNPYEMGPARLIEQPPRRLCYDGPLEDERQLRCLPLVWSR